MNTRPRLNSSFTNTAFTTFLAPTPAKNASLSSKIISTHIANKAESMKSVLNRFPFLIVHTAHQLEPCPVNYASLGTLNSATTITEVHCRLFWILLTFYLLSCLWHGTKPLIFASSVMSLKIRVNSALSFHHDLNVMVCAPIAPWENLCSIL